jgi:cytochrome b561
MREVSKRYSYLGITFHWTMAALVSLQLGAGWWMQRLPAGYGKFEAYQRHVELGFLILLLAVLRVAWRIRTPKPPYTEEVEQLPDWQHVAARLTHLGLYALMVALPLTGWIALFALQPHVRFELFGLGPAPVPPGLSDLPLARADRVEGSFELAHTVLVWTLVVTIVLHIGAALKHHFIDRDPVLTRMAPILEELPEPGDEIEPPTPEPERG